MEAKKLFLYLAVVPGAAPVVPASTENNGTTAVATGPLPRQESKSLPWLSMFAKENEKDLHRYYRLGDTGSTGSAQSQQWLYRVRYRGATDGAFQVSGSAQL